MKKLKKIIQLALLFPVAFVGVSLVFQNEIYADTEPGSYESNSGVGFYGEYIFPSDEKLPEGEKPSESGKLPDSGKVEGNTQLPQTGVKKASMSLVGLVSLLVGTFSLKGKKK